jgi:hypothetical protein
MLHFKKIKNHKFTLVFARVQGKGYLIFTFSLNANTSLTLWHSSCCELAFVFFTARQI